MQDKFKLIDYIKQNYNLNTFNAFLLSRTEYDFVNYMNAAGNFLDSLPNFITIVSRSNKNLELLIKNLQLNDDSNPILYELLKANGFLNNNLLQSNNINALQNLINSDPLFDTQIFINKLEKFKKVVCKVEIIDNDNKLLSTGTGFLISNFQVITNFHVIEDVINTEMVENIRFRFDFDKLDDAYTISSGKLVYIDKTKPIELYSIVCELDKHPTEESIENVQYPDDQLDYVILNILNSTQLSELTSDSSREFIDLNNANSIADISNDLLILQHPDGMSQKLTIGLDRLIGINRNSRRFRYNINTMPGSSGSPIFNTNFQLVGLHNMGDPNYAPRYNQGIVFKRIKEDLINKGFIHG